MIRRCDYCPIEVKEDEGKFWMTGAFLCKVCFQRNVDRTDKIQGSVNISIKKENRQRGIGEY